MCFVRRWSDDLHFRASRRIGFLLMLGAPRGGRIGAVIDRGSGCYVF